MGGGQLHGERADMDLFVAEVIPCVAAPELDVGPAPAVEPLATDVAESAARVERVQTHVLDLGLPLVALGAKVLSRGDACEAETDVEHEEEQRVGETTRGVDAEEETPAGGGEPCPRELVEAHGEQIDACCDGKGKKDEKVPVVPLADAVAEPGTVVVQVGDADAAFRAVGRPDGTPDVAGVAVLHVHGSRRTCCPRLRRTGQLDPVVVFLRETVLLEAVGDVHVLRKRPRVEKRRLESVDEHLQPAVGKEDHHGGRHVVPEPRRLEDEEEHDRQHEHRQRDRQHGQLDPGIRDRTVEGRPETSTEKVDVVRRPEGLVVALRTPSLLQFRHRHQPCQHACAYACAGLLVLPGV